MERISLLFIGIVLILTGCNTDANIASHNLSKAADQFEIYRRVVFYNGMTDSYILTIEGYCSINDYNKQLEVTVKTPEGTYLKHFLGLSENVTYFAEQIQAKEVSVDRYRVIFKPVSIIKNVDIK